PPVRLHRASRSPCNRSPVTSWFPSGRSFRLSADERLATRLPGRRAEPSCLLRVRVPSRSLRLACPTLVESFRLDHRGRSEISLRRVPGVCAKKCLELASSKWLSRGTAAHDKAENRILQGSDRFRGRSRLRSSVASCRAIG